MNDALKLRDGQILLKLYNRLCRAVTPLVHNANFRRSLQYRYLRTTHNIPRSRLPCRLVKAKPYHGTSVLFSLTSAALANLKAHVTFPKLADPRLVPATADSLFLDRVTHNIAFGHC